MLEISFALVFILGALALGNWRYGLTMCVLMAVLQDPLRKLVPNEPAYFVLLVGVVFACAYMGAALMRPRMSPKAIQGWQSQMGRPFALFLLLVGLQAAHSFAMYASPALTGIGLISYLAPIPAVVFAYHYAVRGQLVAVRKWMWVYVFAGLAGLSGVYLEYSGLNWRALGEVGVGQVLYDVGGILKVHSGFFRSSEIAAWHAAAVSCFAFVLLIGRKFTLPRAVVVAALIAVLMSLALLTGRRKVLVMVVVFVGVYFFLVLWFQRRATRPAVMAAALSLVGYILVAGAMAPDQAVSSTRHTQVDPEEKFEHYTVRGSTTFADIPQRFKELGVNPVMWAINGYGWFGAGLGTGTQGAQHVAAAASINRGAAEGGLGKITMELGVPGLLIMAWLALAFFGYVRKLLVVTTRISIPHARMSYGFVAFLVANTASFSIATQVFGDPFVLLMMGWSVGFILAMPVLANKAVAAREKRIAQQRAYQEAIQQYALKERPATREITW